MSWNVESGFGGSYRNRVKQPEETLNDVEKRKDSWWGKVERYTSLDGIADAELGTRLDDKYLKGLWRKTFITDLLWEVDDPGERP